MSPWSSTRGVVLFAVLLALLFAFLSAFVVLVVWYPIGTWKVSGLLPAGLAVLGTHLALMTLYAMFWFNRAKAHSEVVSDVFGILLIQLTAGLYGLSVLAEGRPIALVYAVDRVVWVTANDVRLPELSLSTVPVRLRWAGPLPLLASRTSTDQERIHSIQLALSGYDLPQRPGYWMPIAAQEQAFRARLRPAGDLLAHPREQKEEMDDLLAIPLEVRGKEGVLLLDRQLSVRGFFEQDGTAR